MMGNERLLTACINEDDKIAFGGYGLTNQDALEIAMTLIVSTDAKMRENGTKPGMVRGVLVKNLNDEKRYEEMVAAMMEAPDAEG